MKHISAVALFLLAATPAFADTPLLLNGGLRMGGGAKTATATAGAATLHQLAGVITTEALSTAAGSTYTLTITDNRIAAADQVFASVSFGTATTGVPEIATVKPGAGNVVITVYNDGASAALNGTLKVAFFALKN